MNTVTLDTYKPSCDVVGSELWDEIMSYKQWFPKGFKAHPLLISAQGFAAAGGVRRVFTSGFRYNVGTCEDKYLLVSYGQHDFYVVGEAIIEKTTKDPSWVDDYSEKFWETTKKFIPLADDTYRNFTTTDKKKLCERLVRVVDLGLAPQSYGYITEAFTQTSADFWVIRRMKELAPSLTDDEVKILMQAVTPSFTRVFEEKLREADSTEKLTKILEDYYWVQGSYYVLPELTMDDLCQQREELLGDTEGTSGIKDQKREIINKAGNKKELGSFVHMVETFIAMQDERKANTLRLNYSLFRMVKLIHQVYPKWPEDVLLSCTAHDLINLLDGKVDDSYRDTVVELNKKCAWLFSYDGYCISNDPKIVEPISKLFTESQSNEVTGHTACGGKVKGKVRIVLFEEDSPKVKEGDILVTSMTRPEFIPVMKKAAAFVTNEGGITSHAAIVSREMNKPCIIGTKIATQVLKDGDLVEVDADNGTVKVLRRV